MRYTCRAVATVCGDVVPWPGASSPGCNIRSHPGHMRCRRCTRLLPSVSLAPLWVGSFHSSLAGSLECSWPSLPGEGRALGTGPQDALISGSVTTLTQICHFHALI